MGWRELETEIVKIVRRQQEELEPGNGILKDDETGEFWAYGEAESRSVSGRAVNLSALARDLAKALG